MAQLVVVQFAFVALGAILMCGFVVFKRRKARHEPPRMVPQVRAVVQSGVSGVPSGGLDRRMVPQVRAVVQSQSTQPALIETAASQRPPDAQRQVPRTITLETVSTNGQLNSAVSVSSISVVANLSVVIHPQPVTIQEDRNQRLLAGISENIRKSIQTRPSTTYSPIHYVEKPRETEYVRVKKQIITPHGQIRFSILKDLISTNMLALFRRASLDWKTPEDLIGFIPSYLEPEVDILDCQLLLIGTPGHNEKLAVPIRSFDATSSFRDCFDFVTDVRTPTHTPAVLLPCDADFEVVSRGLISTAFMNPVDGGTDVKLLAEKPSWALQKSYAAALPRT